ncbi:hypothetical protein EsDP_00000995 [Epichloe bromicola]|uniref:Coiled-coil domain-containing protein 16 n=1 Tax=Epichloe bromicola TaxID=79588 RepID=A0ABQ0CGI7_9HYPO
MSSDVRSLLRQQRAARRINHPHAAYSDAGKLLCSLCREQLKAESLWDTHLLSQSHKGHLQQQQQKQQQRKVSSVESSLPLDETSNGRIAKRKLDSADTLEDVEMRDAVRRKRSKSDLMTLAGLPLNGGDGKSEILTPDQIPSAGSNNSKGSTRTPPGLTRTLSTPSQGVELQIPSRPATPAYRDGGSTSSSGGYFGAQSQNGPSTPVAPRAPATTTTGAARTTSKADSAAAAAAPVDESEWAAFEADIAAATVPYDQGAVISAPAMTSEEAAAAKEAEEAASAERKLQVDIDIEAEKEEAKRALEDEFDQMKGLEERVDKLKEMRAAYLKKRSESISCDGVPKPVLEVSNGVRDGVVDDDDDDDDDEDEDDWDSFRFRR